MAISYVCKFLHEKCIVLAIQPKICTGEGEGGEGSGAGTLYSNNFAGFSLEKWRSVQPLPCNVVDFMCL